jgi:hypothetical protein
LRTTLRKVGAKNNDTEHNTNSKQRKSSIRFNVGNE